MWFEMWSNNSNITKIIIYLYTTHFQSFRFLTDSQILTGFPGDQLRTHKKFKMLIVTVDFVSL